MANTVSVRTCLGQWLQRYPITTMGDICGDANWQRHIPEVHKVTYHGYDVSIEALEQAHKSNVGTGFTFEELDLTATVPPQSDLFLVRDVVQHLSFSLAVRAVRNVIRSGTRFLAISSFHRNQGRVADINVGNATPYNLHRAPFDVLRLPTPIELCINHDGPPELRRMDSQLLLIDLHKVEANCILVTHMHEEICVQWDGLQSWENLVSSARQGLGIQRAPLQFLDADGSEVRDLQALDPTKAVEALAVL